ncbi:MAG: class I SAM-dependent methyltransferase [Lachnospiraceae bacterium]|nr:class I SAM-dependent methyltransferase [Lachnospiraceae bacterium]
MDELDQVNWLPADQELIESIVATDKGAVKTTINYYDQNAETFVKGTVDVEFTDVQDRFAALLKTGDHILDFGCGSGRDTKYFLNKGFVVDATDGSAELCRIASELTGISVRQMLFSELNASDIYDGIWACSSILHCPKSELEDVFHKMIRAVKNGGIIYTSFKYGEFEGERRGRYFTDFTEETFQEFILKFPELKIIEERVSTDVRPGRGDEKWLNIILRKQA